MPRERLTPDALVSAAADLADEIGFDHLTLSALAKRSGVRDASLYTHIGGLADLRERVAMLALGEWADALGEAIAGRSGHTALTAFADTYRTLAMGRPGRYAATRHPVPPDRLAASGDAARIIDVCYALLRGYDLSEPDATDAVRLLRSTLHGFSDLEATGGFTADHSLDTSWHRAVEALHHTLTHWSDI
ncbi:TetR/AcrR family transcriptional regulator [Actinoplanes utahensis]|uniref:TetR family transcriptional regulator n=1 Tax=Actinoplanes utahensis TaxID=1869 RepID=A0A0A6USW9_ACTUT|nr:TetR/AcrR family transcriptional regulator [Actinoplanes utahensis]KHD77564.1 TetR family transcriptional regulator [Actinoplanes utahensis]GIF32744.1 transcriptional regulator [Actinoplanes utahensis]